MTDAVPSSAPRRETIALPSVATGTRREIEVLRFGAPGARPKAYLQAGLHADELPGMLVLRVLAGLLEGSEVIGEVVVVPVANPIGLAQQVQGYLRGRYEDNSAGNFNRGYADLA
jgi:predicted deacylase